MLADGPRNLNFGILINSLIQLGDSLNEKDVSAIKFFREYGQNFITDNSDFFWYVIVGSMF